MSMRSKLLAVGTAAVAALALVAAAGPASAAHHPTTAKAAGVQHFLINEIDGREGVVAWGVFAGGGRDVQHGSSDTLHLGGGTVVIRHPDQQSHFRFHLNPTTCVAKIMGRGKYQLVSGTGRFSGVGGHGTYRFSGRAVLGRNASGDCKTHGAPLHEVATIKAHGPAHL